MTENEREWATFVAALGNGDEVVLCAKDRRGVHVLSEAARPIGGDEWEFPVIATGRATHVATRDGQGKLSSVTPIPWSIYGSGYVDPGDAVHVSGLQLD